MDPTSYGYGLSPVDFSQLIACECPTLKDTVYLDHAASPPVPTSAVQSFASALTSTLYANPHSQSPASFTTALEIDRVRRRVLKELFGVGDDGRWDVIFTAGATAALKLVGETFPWDSEARYRYLKEAHTSLVGVRGYALVKGASVESMELSGIDRFLRSNNSSKAETTLWGYPAQCNVTGSRIGLQLARELKRWNENTTVVVDAAAYLSTSMLDLNSIPYHEAPDFIACSFYKIYGHPTGLGALIVKRTSAHLLSSSYFGGGTIDAISISSPFWSYPRKAVHTRHEHGTLPFLSVIALDHAMNTHTRLYGSLLNVSKHTLFVAGLARAELSSLQHANGQHLVRQYYTSSGLSFLEDAGPIIAFSLLDPNGRLVGHKHLENLATIAGFQIRTGGLCNTGVLARVSGLDDDELQELYEGGRVCGDDQEFGGKSGDKPLGLARISFGASSTMDDIHEFVHFLRKYFIISEEAFSLSSSVPLSLSPSLTPNVYLQTLTRYPIKSCAGQPLLNSKLTLSGLQYDREFMLVDPATRKYISQKQFPRLALVRPVIDDEEGVMRVRAEGMRELVVPLDLEVTAVEKEGDKNEDEEGIMGDVRVCSDNVRSYQPSTEAAEWFSTFLGVPCQLHRYPPAPPSSSSKTILSRHTHFDHTAPPAPILLSNESPFSLISQSSVDTVNSWIASDNEGPESAPIHPSCFRANFTISFSPPSTSPSSDITSIPDALPPFHEDTLNLLRIGTQTFQVLARCRRCLMICVNQSTGVRMKEPFSCLARHRRNGKRRIEFGVHLIWREGLSAAYGEDVAGEATVGVGDRVIWAEVT